MSSYTYVWHGTSRTPGKPQARTPSRSSRQNGFTNWIHYNAFERSDGQIFSVGDAVQVWEGFEFSHAQFWLDPYKSYGTESRYNYERRVGQPEASTSTVVPSSYKSKAVARAKDASLNRPTSPRKNGRHKPSKGKMAQREAEEDDWIVDDGLDDCTKFGIIADLFEDERGNMRVAIHWLARPRLLAYAFGKAAGIEEGLDETHRRELLYTCDPAEVMVQSRALKNSRAEDIVDVAYVLNSIRVLSEKAFESERSACQSDTQNIFFIRKALNTKADSGEGWFYDISWQDVREQCLACGNWELAVGRAAKRAKKKAEDKVAKSSPSKRRRVRSSTAGDENDGESDKRGRKKRSSSVATDATSDDSDISESSSQEEEEIDEDDTYRARQRQDEDDEEHSDEDSEDETEVQTPDDEHEFDDHMDVFGPVSSARKRKSPGKANRESPQKRSRTFTAVLRPSAASMRAAAKRAERKAQRLAERQARRQKPRLPLSQRCYLGAAADSMEPFERARAVLHVGCTPDYLPCRDNEYTEIEAYLEDAIDEGVGSCIYVAGVPGTGKTATIRSVVSALQERAIGGEIKPFRFLEVNGMKIADPAQSFTILWEFISGARLPAKQALVALERHFTTPNPGRDTCVILVDELDQLVTKKQEVIYNFFNWPNQSHSRLIVLAVANTMDLPERELSNKINSRLGSNRINFKPYDRLQLTEILMSRLEGLDGVFDKAAIGLVSAKVAAVTGDARRALDICRRAVETVEAENAVTGVKRVVSTGDIVKVHTSMTSSGLMQFVQRAGLHQRIMLLALSRAIRKLGIDEVEFGDVVRWHLDFCRQSAMTPLPTHAQLFSILQSLADMRLVTTEGARLDYYQRVQANVRDDELELVLRKQQQFTHLLR